MIGYCVCGSFPAKRTSATSTTTLSYVYFSRINRAAFEAIRDNFATFSALSSVTIRVRSARSDKSSEMPT